MKIERELFYSYLIIGILLLLFIHLNQRFRPLIFSQQDSLKRPISTNDYEASSNVT